MILIITLIPFIVLTVIMWKLLKKSTASSYAKTKNILIIYISILLLSMAIDEGFLKNKRLTLARGNVKESFETVDKLYMGNAEDIKDKYIYDEWVFPYTEDKLIVNELNGLQMMIERVKELKEVKATLYYDQIINNHEMRYSGPIISLNLENQQLDITRLAEDRVYNRVLDSTIFYELSSRSEYNADLGGGSNSFAILYMQVPTDLIIETNEDAWIDYIRE